MIEHWKTGKEYSRLSESVRERLEQSIRSRELVASKTCLFLMKMKRAVETIWPKDGARIPFYEQKWLERKLIHQIAQEID